MKPDFRPNCCFNCKYFGAFYIKNCNGFVMIKNNGYCKAKEITKQERRKFPFTEACEYWEFSDEEREKQRILYSAEAALIDISFKIRYIADMLSYIKNQS